MYLKQENLIRLIVDYSYMILIVWSEVQVRPKNHSLNEKFNCTQRNQNISQNYEEKMSSTWNNFHANKLLRKQKL